MKYHEGQILTITENNDRVHLIQNAVVHAFYEQMVGTQVKVVDVNHSSGTYEIQYLNHPDAQHRGGVGNWLDHDLEEVAEPYHAPPDDPFALC